MVVSVGPGRVRVSVFGVESSPGAEELRASLPESLAGITRAPGNAERRAERRAALAEAVGALEVAVGSDVVSLTYASESGGGLSLVAAALRVGIPMLAGTAGRGGIGFSRGHCRAP